MTATICDYTGYDYKQSFWTNKNREYEHQSEIDIISSFIQTYCSKKTSILDAGCGYGRLYPSYESLFERTILVDFSKDLLDLAKKDIKRNTARFYQQSLYDLNIDEKVNTVISIRTLHHLNDSRRLFQQFFNALDDNGILILDIPNKLHLKNRIKYLFKRNLYNDEDIKLSENFYNYKPQKILNKLEECGFKVIRYQNVGLFRINIIKRILKIQWLIKIEHLLNRYIPLGYIAPSIYVVARKHVENYVEK